MPTRSGTERVLAGTWREQLDVEPLLGWSLVIEAVPTVLAA